MTVLLSRSLRALHATVGVHLFTAFLAATTASAVGLSFKFRPHSLDELRQLTEWITAQPAVATGWATSLGIGLLASVITAPFLRLFWLRAIATGAPTGACAAAALHCWGSAVLRSLTVLMVAGLGVGSALWLGLELERWTLDAAESVRLQTWALCALPAGAWCGLCAAWHDLEYASLADDPNQGPLVRPRNMLAALHPRTWLGWLAQATLALLLTASAVFLSQLQHGPETLWGAQVLLLLRSFVRSVWLARAVELASPHRL